MESIEHIALSGGGVAAALLIAMQIIFLFVKYYLGPKLRSPEDQAQLKTIGEIKKASNTKDTIEVLQKIADTLQQTSEIQRETMIICKENRTDIKSTHDEVIRISERLNNG